MLLDICGKIIRHSKLKARLHVPSNSPFLHRLKMGPISRMELFAQNVKRSNKPLTKMGDGKHKMSPCLNVSYLILVVLGAYS